MTLLLVSKLTVDNKDTLRNTASSMISAAIVTGKEMRYCECG